MPCELRARIDAVFLKRALIEKAEDEIASGFELGARRGLGPAE
jgi:hypothetical protein